MNCARAIIELASLARAFASPVLMAAALLCHGAVCRSVWGATDGTEPGAGLSTPYKLVVNLQFSDSPAFTRLFTEGIQRQVHDQLRNFFGPLAEVQVVGGHPLAERSAVAGLRGLTFEPAELAAVKTAEQIFLVALDYRDGSYQIEWRVVDTSVQQVGGYRSRSTPDRQWVVKAICLAVKDDFAPVATIRVRPEKDLVSLDVQGAGLGARVGDWLGENAILQPLWVVRQRDGTLLRVPIPYTVLRMDKPSRVTTAHVASNLKNPWKKSARVIGFQAWKLRTQSGRFRLRLVDKVTGAPAQSCAVSASDTGFDDITDAHRLAPPDPRGMVVAAQPFTHLAYIRITQGGGSVQLPLPITQDWCEVDCKVAVDKAASEKSDLERQIRYLLQDMRALQTSLDDYVKEANDLHQNKRYEEAQRKVAEALKFIGPNERSAREGLRETKRIQEELGGQPSPLLARVEEQVESLTQRGKDLETLEQNLVQTIDDNAADSRARSLIGFGKQALSDGQGDEAIEKYELALAEFPDNERFKKARDDLKSYVERLKEAWRIKSPAHQAARDFFYDDWPSTEVTEVGARLADAKLHLAALAQAGDFISLNKVNQGNQDLLADLGDLIDQLSEGGTEEDTQEQEKYTQVMEDVAAFVKEWEEVSRDLLQGEADAPSDATGGAASAPPANDAEPSAEEEEPSTGSAEPSAEEEEPAAEVEEDKSAGESATEPEEEEEEPPGA